MSCIFCEILAGRIPGLFVYRDEHVAAFMDIQPIKPGHVLVIPTKHAVGLGDLDPADGGRVFAVGQRVAAALRVSGLRCEGVNLFLADGTAAGQEVFHAHLHVFPRFAGDGFGLRFPPGYGAKPERAALKEAADKIQAAL
jgi:histidine triad (HIT) family protein